MSQQQSFTINLISSASASTNPDNALANFTTVPPQSLNLQGTWEVALVELSCAGLIENVTEDLFNNHLNRNDEIRDTTTQKTIIERPHFGNRMVSMYVPRRLLQRNSSALDEELPAEVFFHEERLLQFG